MLNPCSECVEWFARYREAMDAVEVLAELLADGKPLPPERREALAVLIAKHKLALRGMGQA